MPIYIHIYLYPYLCLMMSETDKNKIQEIICSRGAYIHIYMHINTSRGTGLWYHKGPPINSPSAQFKCSRDLVGKHTNDDDQQTTCATLPRASRSGFVFFFNVIN